MLTTPPASQRVPAPTARPRAITARWQFAAHCLALAVAATPSCSRSSNDGTPPAQPDDAGRAAPNPAQGTPTRDGAAPPPPLDPEAGTPREPRPPADSGAVAPAPSDGSAPLDAGSAGGTGGAPTAAAGAGGRDGAGNAGAGGAMGEPCPPVPAFVEPTKLSDTGLYSDTTSGALAPGVFEYAPQYELWSDSAAKRRFVYLPPCTQIDTSDMDFWSYPMGTKLWKEFVRDDAEGNPVRVETRLIQKYTASKWFMTAFIWNEEQTEAYAGTGDDDQLYVLAENASGTEHDVPGRGACAECHSNMWDKVLGFSALQLSRAADANFMTLQRLIDEGRLSAPPELTSTPLQLPGTPEQTAALGYLHANCGHCHNPFAKQANLGLELWTKLTGVQSVTETVAYTTTVGLDTQTPEKPPSEPELRIVPGDPDASALYWRMIQPPVFPAMPEGGAHMPLIGSEVTDEAGVALVRAWISSMQ